MDVVKVVVNEQPVIVNKQHDGGKNLRRSLPYISPTNRLGWLGETRVERKTGKPPLLEMLFN